MHIAAQTILWIVGTCAGFNAAVFTWISYRRDLYRDPTTWFLVGGLAAFSAACIVTALDAWSDDWAKAAWALLAVSTTALLIRRVLRQNRLMA